MVSSKNIFKHFIGIIILLLTGLDTVKAQYFNSWPLYATACEVDTDCVKYANVKATYQIDSTYVSGKLMEVDINTYNMQGIILHCMRKVFDGAKRREETDYEFDKNQICVLHRTYVCNDSDTVSFTTFRSLHYDTLLHNYGYELTTGPDRVEAKDSLWDDLSLRFVDSKCKVVWVNAYINRYVVEVQESVGSSLSTAHVYGFHNQDTLYSQIIVSGAGHFPVDTITTYFQNGERARTIMVNGRIKETLTTVNGVITEFHIYNETIQQGRIVETAIYNRMVDDTLPEVEITYSDSAIVVRKGKVYPFIDNHPEPIFAREEESPVAPAPTLESMFPYKKTKKLPDGLTQIEYYNFYSGTIKPLLIIQKDDRGIVHTFISSDWVCRRIVK